MKDMEDKGDTDITDPVTIVKKNFNPKVISHLTIDLSVVAMKLNAEAMTMVKGVVDMEEAGSEVSHRVVTKASAGILVATTTEVAEAGMEMTRRLGQKD